MTAAANKNAFVTQVFMDASHRDSPLPHQAAAGYRIICHVATSQEAPALFRACGACHKNRSPHDLEPFTLFHELQVAEPAKFAKQREIPRKPCAEGCDKIGSDVQINCRPKSSNSR